MKEIMERSKSEIDKSSLIIVLAHDSGTRNKDYAKAEELYRRVYEGNSFFSPYAGICVWSNLRRQGKAEEAEKFKAGLVERMPGCRDLISKYEREKR